MARLAMVNGRTCYVKSSMVRGEAGDFIDAFVDALRESSPGTKCFDEDTIRATLAALIGEDDEE